MQSKMDEKKIKEWIAKQPILTKIMQTEEVFWINDHLLPFSVAQEKLPYSLQEVNEAEQRWKRFAPLLAELFPETKNGIIESPLIHIPRMKFALENRLNQPIIGDLYVKCDSHLPIAGSVKARGGIYEILKYAEQLAIEHQLITNNDNYRLFASKKMKEFFSLFSIIVGSTGNLGLSIGIISAKLGFKVTVHMSKDAKEWKKSILREFGVNVVEHSSDYSKAVEIGRKEADENPNSYFVDDENSKDLFFGYSVAALRLKKQLDELNIKINDKNPLFVYLPCGVGGAPGGIAFGLKQIFKDDVHVFFAEPTHSPSMLLGMLTGLHHQVSVTDFGIDNQTDADGLAVGRPSGFVGKLMEPLLDGIYTVKDEELFRLLFEMYDTENIQLEPSALAGLFGPVQAARQRQLKLDQFENITHICWATGGSLLPKDVFEDYVEKGAKLRKRNGKSV
jgi:D-serine dehydratase